MTEAELPQRWREIVKEYLARPEAKYPQLSLADFIYHVRLEFEDNSYVYFRDAFYLVDHSLQEIALFTEHCGYHVFPIQDTVLKLFDLSDNPVCTEHFRIE